MPPALILSILFFLGVVSVSSSSQAHIRFENNAYTGISVSLSPDVPNSQREALIKELQLLFQRTSDLLYEASEKKAFMKEVNFLIPKSWPIQWSLVKSSGGVKKTRTQTISDADFILQNPADALFDNPLTIQFAGCGKAGLQIQMSSKFIANQTLSLEERSKILLSNWAKYRYGVFDEHGFPGDKLYPLFWNTPGAAVMTADQEKVTSCAATASDHILETIETENRTSSGMLCSLRVNPSTGRPDDSSDCIPFANRNLNNDVVSSLLSHPSLSNNKYFCNSNTHNSKAPNKQNNLCEGLSTGEVISRHSDIIDSRPADIPAEQRKITFKFVQEEDARLTFIVDMNHNKKSEITSIVNALNRFKNGLNDASELLILDMETSQSVHRVGSEQIYWSLRNEFTPTIWGRKSDGPICLKCVIDIFEKSLTTIKNPMDTSSELVIITEGNISDKESEVNAIASSLIQRGVSLRVVVFPYFRGSNIEPIRELVSKVKGSIHLIPLTDSRPQPVASQLQLFDAFDSFLTMNQNLLIARQTFDPASRKIEFNFQLDSSLFHSHVELVAQFYSSNKSLQLSLEPSYVLKGEGRREWLTKSREFKREDEKFVVPLNNALPGHWKLELKSESNDSFVGVAYARVSGRQRNPIAGKCIFTEESYSADRITPAALYVMLTRDQASLVQNAELEAIITNESGHIVSGNSGPMRLSDDGLGVPDITKGDGIYSRYLIEANQKGFYHVQVLVRNQPDTQVHTGSVDVEGLDCCGSSMPKPTRNDVNSRSISNLERLIDCGFLYINTGLDPGMVVHRISDVRVDHVDMESRRVVVSFSEPVGVGVEYEIRMFKDYDSIRDNFSRGTSLMAPVQGPFYVHERRAHSFNVTDINGGIFHIAIRSKSASGGFSAISNIVSFHMEPDPSTLTTEVDDLFSMQTSSRHPSGSGLRGFEVWQIVAIAAISVMLIAITIACCICLCLKKKRRSSKESETQKNSFPAVNALHSNLTIQTTIGSADNMSGEKTTPAGVNSDMHGVKLTSASSDRNLAFAAHAELNSRTVDFNKTISPVQSWPAEVLLGHYGKVQQAREKNQSPPVVKIEDVLPDGSYSTGSDNPSRDSSQYDDNMEHAYPLPGLTNGQDWRYENVHVGHAQPAYVTYGVPPVYGEPAFYDPTHMTMWPHQQHQQPQHQDHRQFMAQRPQTPSESCYPQPELQRQFQQQQRRSTNTVSQV